MTVLQELEHEALAVLDGLLPEEGQAEATSTERALEIATEVVACTPPLTPARARRLVREQPDWLFRACELPGTAPISAFDVLEALVAEHIVRVVCASAGCDRPEERLLQWPECHGQPVGASTF
jgi:hypothetical protein